MLQLGFRNYLSTTLALTAMNFNVPTNPSQPSIAEIPFCRFGTTVHLKTQSNNRAAFTTALSETMTKTLSNVCASPRKLQMHFD